MEQPATVHTIGNLFEIEWIPLEKQQNIIHGVIEKHLEYLSSFGDKFGDKDWRKAVMKKDIAD
jgi:hypothetical protein